MMERVLLVCDSSEFEKEFIKNYLYGINYTQQDGQYIGQNEVINVVKPYQMLVGYRADRVFIDKELNLDEMYIAHVKLTIRTKYPNSKSGIEYV